ncbi:uncharacterized protein N7446_011347 [Penicillium canescens]|uniref:uncharacterized protein n=1 Tax=Penicillium canescens TaxID=5083 RepID=UPI0026E08D82|nr:uncharacterized protein N7446_011347 [Penicillium canescens]KAJ6048664.1 hypothetical protein N7446_011347 [Penicillium canescens]
MPGVFIVNGSISASKKDKVPRSGHVNTNPSSSFDHRIVSIITLLHHSHPSATQFPLPIGLILVPWNANDLGRPLNDLLVRLSNRRSSTGTPSPNTGIEVCALGPEPLCIFPSKTSFAFLARRRFSEREPSAAHFFGSYPSDSDLPSVDVGDGPPSERILPSILCADVYPSLSATTNELNQLISYACKQR